VKKANETEGGGGGLPSNLPEKKSQKKGNAPPEIKWRKGKEGKEPKVWHGRLPNKKEKEIGDYKGGPPGEGKKESKRERSSKRWGKAQHQTSHQEKKNGTRCPN